MPWPTGRTPSETSAAALRRVNARSASVSAPPDSDLRRVPSSRRIRARCSAVGDVDDHQRHAPIRQHDGHRGEHGLIDFRHAGGILGRTARRAQATTTRGS